MKQKEDLTSHRKIPEWLKKEKESNEPVWHHRERIRREIATIREAMLSHELAKAREI